VEEEDNAEGMLSEVVDWVNNEHIQILSDFPLYPPFMPNLELPGDHLRFVI